MTKRKRRRVSLKEKERMVSEVAHYNLVEGLSVPDACEKVGIETYTYYNWQKRLAQINSRRIEFKKGHMPIIIRKPVKQIVPTPPDLKTVDLPPNPLSEPATAQKLAIVITDTDKVNSVLRELGF